MVSTCVFNRRKGVNGCSALTRKQCGNENMHECECPFFKDKDDYKLTIEGYIEEKED